MWTKELETAKRCAVEAGKAVMEIYNDVNNVSVEYKSDHSPLTIVDKASNKIIMDGMGYRGHAVCSRRGGGDIQADGWHGNGLQL